jgi:hypothetical protein
MRKNSKPQSQTPGTIENLREAMLSMADDIHNLEKIVLDQQAVINYLEKKLERTNPVRGN